MGGLEDLVKVDLTARLAKVQAQTLIIRILSTQTSLISFTGHARKEMAKDDIDTLDILNILKGGRVYEEGERDKGSWRYRVHKDNFCVVVAFRNPHQLVVITAWRKER